MQMPPIVTERAFERLAEIGASGQGMGLRVAVEGGGCSGFQYDIKLDQAAADDLVLEGKGESVIVDLVSLPFSTTPTPVPPAAAVWVFRCRHSSTALSARNITFSTTQRKTSA